MQPVTELRLYDHDDAVGNVDEDDHIEANFSETFVNTLTAMFFHPDSRVV